MDRVLGFILLILGLACVGVCVWCSTLDFQNLSILLLLAVVAGGVIISSGIGRLFMGDISENTGLVQNGDSVIGVRLTKKVMVRRKWTCLVEIPLVSILTVLYIVQIVISYSSLLLFAVIVSLLMLLVFILLSVKFNKNIKNY